MFFCPIYRRHKSDSARRKWMMLCFKQDSLFSLDWKFIVYQSRGSAALKAFLTALPPHQYGSFSPEILEQIDLDSLSAAQLRKVPLQRLLLRQEHQSLPLQNGIKISFSLLKTICSFNSILRNFPTIRFASLSSTIGINLERFRVSAFKKICSTGWILFM